MPVPRIGASGALASLRTSHARGLLGRTRQYGSPAGQLGQLAGTQTVELSEDESVERPGPGPGSVDLVLSSGWLGFALHSGVIQAIEDAGLRVSAVMGTSSGALAGSLYAAGYSPTAVARELSRVPPIRLLRRNARTWEGFFVLDGVVNRLRDLLPATFEELDRDFVVGAVDARGRHVLLDSGPLPEAVAASACVPLVFRAVEIPGSPDSPFVDGGLVDRVCVEPFRQRRRAQLGGAAPPAIVHVISRSTPFSGRDAVSVAPGDGAVHVVRSRRVTFREANLWSLGDFHGMMRKAYARAMPAVRAVQAETALAQARGGVRAAE